MEVVVELVKHDCASLSHIASDAKGKRGALTLEDGHIGPLKCEVVGVANERHIMPPAAQVLARHPTSVVHAATRVCWHERNPHYVAPPSLGYLTRQPSLPPA
jgi:hypothetical protein